MVLKHCPTALENFLEHQYENSKAAKVARSNTVVMSKANLEILRQTRRTAKKKSATGIFAMKDAPLTTAMKAKLKNSRKADRLEELLEKFKEELATVTKERNQYIDDIQELQRGPDSDIVSEDEQIAQRPKDSKKINPVYLTPSQKPGDVEMEDTEKKKGLNLEDLYATPGEKGA